MDKIILATRSKGKIAEFSELLDPYKVEILTTYDLDEPLEVQETEDTFRGNARLKATAYMELTGYPALADDSGLIVESLGEKPGVYSSRYAGINATDKENNEKLLHELKDVPMDRRNAKFISAIALVFPNNSVQIVEGTCEGIILEEPKGDNGFGYDPLFYVPEVKKTYAEMTSKEKNQYSHRAKAMQKLARILPSVWR
ncbi:MAG: XTP/dITP diphosphatase [Clostridia bacterium]